MLREFTTFMAAVSMTATPVLAQSSAAPLSVARAGASSEEGSHLAGGNWLPPVLFALIVIGGVLLATGVLFDDDDRPRSP